MTCLKKTFRKTSKNLNLRSKGFTLVEVMIVIAIIGLLAAVAYPSFKKARMDSQRAACINNLRQMATAKNLAGFENNWDDSDGPGSVGNPLYRDTISSYIKGGEAPDCPTGATLYYNGLSYNPTCQSGIATHVYAE